LGGLFFDTPFHDFHRCGVKGDLAGCEKQASDDYSLAVGAYRGWCGLCLDYFHFSS
jgi:hypothetical protein